MKLLIPCFLMCLFMHAFKNLLLIKYSNYVTNPITDQNRLSYLPIHFFSSKY